MKDNNRIPHASRACVKPVFRKRVLLRSSWQVVNIGDIAHTPGVLRLLEEHNPDVEVVLWASDDLSDDVAAMEHRRFPLLKIVKGHFMPDGHPSNADLADAVAWCDFLLHGSGPSLVAFHDVADFVKFTGKPYGVFGITYGGGDSGMQELLCQARFLFFRDSVSLSRARSEGITAPIMAFGPDGAFAADVRDDVRAEAYLDRQGLEPGKFMCCIGRLRYTPYWEIVSAPFNAERHAINEAKKEADHKPLQAAISRVVRETGLRILICPEDRTQMKVGRELLYHSLPDDVRREVVCREDFWLTDEAISTYARSAGVFGNEMHSPIMSIGQGVPAVVCRWAAQTSKGFMWRDIGLGEWLFDFDDPHDPPRVADTVLEIARNPEEASSKARAARERVRVLQREMTQALAAALD